MGRCGGQGVNGRARKDRVLARCLAVGRRRRARAYQCQDIQKFLAAGTPAESARNAHIGLARANHPCGNIHVCAVARVYFPQTEAACRTDRTSDQVSSRVWKGSSPLQGEQEPGLALLSGRLERTHIAGFRRSNGKFSTSAESHQTTDLNPHR
ncbi:hypothetical protein VTN02DRAFT_2868 [Thermoascus thermophilus]